MIISPNKTSNADIEPDIANNTTTTSGESDDSANENIPPAQKRQYLMANHCKQLLSNGKWEVAIVGWGKLFFNRQHTLIYHDNILS